MMSADLLSFLVNVDTGAIILYRHLRALDTYYILNIRYRINNSTMHFMNYDIMFY